MGREGGAQETELAPATGTGPWLTKVRKTIDGTASKPAPRHAPRQRPERTTFNMMLTFGARFPSWQKCVGNMFYVRVTDPPSNTTDGTRRTP